MHNIIKLATLTLAAAGATLALSAGPAQATTPVEWDSSTGCPVGSAWQLRDISGIPAKYKLINAVAQRLDKNDDSQLCIKVVNNRLKGVVDNKPIAEEPPAPVEPCDEGYALSGDGVAPLHRTLAPFDVNADLKVCTDQNGTGLPPMDNRIS